jgi:hypothetical protein
MLQLTTMINSKDSEDWNANSPVCPCILQEYKQWHGHKHSDQTQKTESPRICNKNNQGEKNRINNQTPKKNTVSCILDKLYIMNHGLLWVSFRFWSDLLSI